MNELSTIASVAEILGVSSVVILWQKLGNRVIALRCEVSDDCEFEWFQ